MEIEVYGLAVIPIILALVEVFKRVVGIAPRFLPLIALALGILAGFFYVSPDDPFKAIFIGITLGLSASGLWSGTKNSIGR